MNFYVKTLLFETTFKEKLSVPGNAKPGFYQDLSPKFFLR